MADDADNTDSGENAAAGGPPPLGGDDATPKPDEGGSSMADSMEQSLPESLSSDATGVALGQGSMSEKDEKNFAMLAHILGIIPLLGPLAIWIMKRDESPFVNDQGREAVSFQLVVVIVLALSLILASIPFVQCIAWILPPTIWLIEGIMAVMAGLKAGDGITYRYPFALRVL